MAGEGNLRAFCSLASEIFAGGTPNPQFESACSALIRNALSYSDYVYIVPVKIGPMSQWLNGPMSEHAIWLLGVKVFWWKRFFTVVGLALNGLFFFTLINNQHKALVSDSLNQWAKQSKAIKIESGISIRRLFLRALAAVIVFSAVSALVAGIWNDWRVSQIAGFAILTGLLLSTILLPIAIELAVITSGAIGSWRLIRRVGTPVLAWLFQPTRFDRSIMVLSFIGVAMITVGQLVVT